MARPDTDGRREPHAKVFRRSLHPAPTRPDAKLRRRRMLRQALEWGTRDACGPVGWGFGSGRLIDGLLNSVRVNEALARDGSRRTIATGCGTDIFASGLQLFTVAGPAVSLDLFPVAPAPG